MTIKVHINIVYLIVKTKKFSGYLILFFLLVVTFVFAYVIKNDQISQWFSRAATQTIKINPAADTFVRSDYPNNNYGNSLIVSTDNTPIKIAYFKFNLNILAGKTIKSVRFKAKVTDSSADLQKIKETSNSWSETTLKYSNKPARGSLIASFPGGTAGNWINVDVTSFVNKFKGKTASLAIESTGSNLFNINSRQSTYKPYLMVEYADSIIPTPTPTGTKKINAVPPGITKKVLVLNFDPLIGTTPLTQYQTAYKQPWNNISGLQDQYKQALKEASANYANFQIVQTQNLNEYPVKTYFNNGSFYPFSFTNQQYLDCLYADYMNQTIPAYCYYEVDYYKLINNRNLCGLAINGTIDEVWMWGGPWFGYNESLIKKCSSTKNLPIMGFNYSTGTPEMIHDFAHRTESLMDLVYGFRQVNLNNAWNRYTIYDKAMSGKSSCGTAHYAPNSLSEYDYANSTYVTSRCNDWLGFPSTRGNTDQINSSAWNGSTFEKWWISHLPKTTGLTNNKLNNWWAYTVDYDNAILPVTGGERWYTVEPGSNDSNTSCTTNSSAALIYFGVNTGCSPASNFTANLVFNNVQIPKNANVTEAYLEVVSGGNYSNPLSESIVVTDGTTVSNTKVWNIDTGWTAGTVYDSVSLQSIVSQLVSSSSWSAGKNITVKVSHVSGSGSRGIRAFEGEPLGAAKLVIVIDGGAVPSLIPSKTPTRTPTPIIPNPTEPVTVIPPNTKYCPTNSVTRDQMAVFLLKVKHVLSTYVPPAATGTMFTDVPATYWAAAWIEQLAREGITGGCGTGKT